VCESKRVCVAHGVRQLVPSVLQLVVAGVESEGLHDIRAGPQELPVQLSHYTHKTHTWPAVTDLDRLCKHTYK